MKTVISRTLTRDLSSVRSALAAAQSGAGTARSAYVEAVEKRLAALPAAPVPAHR
jgi:hypothetical protein